MSVGLAGSSLDAAAGQARDNGALHDEADEHRRQRGEHARRRDQPVVGDAATGEVGDGDGQGLGALVGGEQQRIEEFVPGEQEERTARSSRPPARPAAG